MSAPFAKLGTKFGKLGNKLLASGSDLAALKGDTNDLKEVETWPSTVRRHQKKSRKRCTNGKREP